MSFKRVDIAANSRGGTELMIDGLEKRLIAAGRQDLIDAVDIYPSRVRDYEPGRPSVFWAHDLPGDPESDFLADPETDYEFDAYVFVSNWQQQAYARHYNHSDMVAVIGNAIEPFTDNKRIEAKRKHMGLAFKPANPIKLIYHTTPHRGLEVLWPVYELLSRRWAADDIHTTLDVYSSFDIYGWGQRDEPYRPLFDAISNHDRCTYHGARPNEEVREALYDSHIFAFPSIWSETSCIAAIEAMSAGVRIVHSNLAALPETTGGLTHCYPHHPTLNTHANIFAHHLNAAVRSEAMRQVDPMLPMAQWRANALHNWDTVTAQWIGLLESIVAAGS